MRASERVRQPNTTLRIIESGALRAGDQLTLRTYSDIACEVRETVTQWISVDVRQGRRRGGDDQVKPCAGPNDSEQYAPTTLVKEIVEQATGARPVGRVGVALVAR